MKTEPDEGWAHRVAEWYSFEARAYKDLWAPLLLPHGEELLSALPLPAAARVLDIGAGCGSLLPSIVRHAPAALILGIDRAAGMLALAPSEIPRAVMDAGCLAVASGAIDVGVVAFVLFHTPDPRQVLAEVRRVLRAGGAVGTTTWEGDPNFTAQRAWLEELDAHGAAPAEPLVTNHEPVCTPERVRSLVEGAGFGSVRTWTRPFGHAYTVDEFIAVRTNHGWSRRRFESLATDTRRTFLASARRRLDRMTEHDLVDNTEIIFATAEAF